MLVLRIKQKVFKSQNIVFFVVFFKNGLETAKLDFSIVELQFFPFHILASFKV